MPGNRWTREQDLAVLYLRHRGMGRHDPEARELARAMNRTEAAIWMRKGNFDFLDPSVSGGLSNLSKLTRTVWDEYQRDPVRILAEARSGFLNILADDTQDATLKMTTRARPTRAAASQADVFDVFELMAPSLDEPQGVRPLKDERHTKEGGAVSQPVFIVITLIIFGLFGLIVWNHFTDDSEPVRSRPTTTGPNVHVGRTGPTAVPLGSYSPKPCTPADYVMERMYVEGASDSDILRAMVDYGITYEAARQRYVEFQSGVYCVVQ